jgi:transposase-like protein
MSKTKCKLSEEKYEEKKPGKPRFKCAKCGRVAKKEEGICKAEKVK